MNIRAEIGAAAQSILLAALIIVGGLAIYETYIEDKPTDTISRVCELPEQQVTYSTIPVEKVETPIIVNKTAKSLPRGVRNNNPLNLRHGNDWQGELSTNADGEFEAFIDSAYGFRAAAKTIRTYQRKYGLDTLNEIIHRFSPPSENHTSEYVAFISDKLRIDSDEPIDLMNNDNLLAELLLYMSFMEVGHHYDYDDAMSGVMLASGNYTTSSLEA